MTIPLGRCLSLTTLSAFTAYHYTRSIHIQRESLCTSNEAWYRSLPLRETSRFGSRLLSVNIYPRSLRKPLYKYFCRIFDGDINECEYGPDHLDYYANFGQFFRRNLKPGVRPIDKDSSIVSPCDGEILANGLVTSVENLNIIIKGIPYTIKDLFQFDQYEIERLQKKQSKSSLFYACIYLNPGNYHHFHSPAKWKISERRHITGTISITLWIRRTLASARDGTGTGYPPGRSGPVPVVGRPVFTGRAAGPVRSDRLRPVTVPSLGPAKQL
jgi:hypothetical protein